MACLMASGSIRAQEISTHADESLLVLCPIALGLEAVAGE